MEHPLLPDISHIPLDELQGKISDLHRKMAFAARSGNAHLVNQIHMVLEGYQREYSKKLDEFMGVRKTNPENPDSQDDDNFGSFINIS